MKDQLRSRGLSRPVVRQLLMLLVSLAVGAVGVHQSRQHIEAKINEFTDKPVVQELTTQVVVPARPLAAGEIVSANDLSLREIPQQYADSNSVTAEHYQLAVGQRIDFDVDEGRPLLWAHLSGGVSPTFSGHVSQGLRAMSVRVDEINSLSGFLQPGDKVDLLLSHGLGDGQTVVPLIQQLEIIATGSQTQVDKSDTSHDRHFSTITVHVSPRNAQKLTLAQQAGKLTAVLRNPQDVTAIENNPLSLKQLFASDEKALPLPVRKKKSKPAVLNIARARPAIEYIIGGK